MKIIRYHIELDDAATSFHVMNITESVNGSLVSSVSKFDGVNTLALIDCPEDQTEYLDEIIEADDYVISYRYRT